MRFLSVVLLLMLWMPARAASAERFPKPDPHRAFASWKLYDAAGSPVRTAREDWDGARERIRADAAWREWLVRRRAELDGWMAEPRDKPEYIAGWWHDFVNPVDGGFLEWTPMPPVDAPPKVFGGWVFGLRSRNGSNMVEAARMWRLTGEIRYFDWAAAQLDFYASNLAQWPIQTSKSKSQLMHQSLDDANMLVRFVETARLLEGEVPEGRRAAWAARRQQWIDRLFRPMTLLLDETFQRVHNIACWQRSAMAMAAIYTKDEELWKRAVDGEFGIRRQVRDGITSDYFWLEQSLGYNSYVVSAFLPLFTMAGLDGRLDELRTEAEAVENLMLAPAAIVFPAGTLPTPADTTGAQRKFPDLGMLAGARRVFPTARGVKSAIGAWSWDSLLDPPDSIEKWVSVEETVRSRNLESSRFAVLRDGEWQVFFHYGQLDRSHAQQEALNYEAFFGRIDATHDAGTVGYGSPLHGAYYTKAWAHNVPVIDGQGQQGWNEGELLEFSAENSRVTARQPKYRENASATRTLAIQDGTLREETLIETADGIAHRLGIIVNVQGSIAIPQNAASCTQPVFPHWDACREWQTGSPLTLTATLGGRPLVLRITGPGPLRVVQATVPDAPPRKRQAIYVETTASSARFVTEWGPQQRRWIPQ
jgi:hypothetical protein